MMSDLSILKPTKVLIRRNNSLNGLKAIDANTLSSLIGIFAMCLVVMEFIFYAVVQNAHGVVAYAVVAGGFIVTGSDCCVISARRLTDARKSEGHKNVVRSRSSRKSVLAK